MGPITTNVSWFAAKYVSRQHNSKLKLVVWGCISRARKLTNYHGWWRICFSATVFKIKIISFQISLGMHILSPAANRLSRLVADMFLHNSLQKEDLSYLFGDAYLEPSS